MRDVLEARGKLAESGLTAECMSGELAAGESGRVGSALAPVGVECGVWKAGEGGAGVGRTGVLTGAAAPAGGAAAPAGCSGGGAGSNLSSSSSRKDCWFSGGRENRNGSGI